MTDNDKSPAQPPDARAVVREAVEAIDSYAGLWWLADAVEGKRDASEGGLRLGRAWCALRALLDAPPGAGNLLAGKMDSAIEFIDSLENDRELYLDVGACRAALAAYRASPDSLGGVPPPEMPSLLTRIGEERDRLKADLARVTALLDTTRKQNAALEAAAAPSEAERAWAALPERLRMAVIREIADLVHEHDEIHEADHRTALGQARRVLDEAARRGGAQP